VNYQPKEIPVGPPLHLVLHDNDSCAVVEFHPDGTVISDNPVQVATNAPYLDWDLTNVADDLSLTPDNPKPIEIGGTTFAPSGQGQGLRGLPADENSPSRFIRLMTNVRFAQQPKDQRAAELGTVRILHGFDLVPGTVMEDTPMGPMPLLTAWSTASNLTAQRSIYSSTGDPLRYVIDLKKTGFSTSRSVEFVTMGDSTPLSIRPGPGVWLGPSGHHVDVLPCLTAIGQTGVRSTPARRSCRSSGSTVVAVKGRALRTGLLTAALLLGACSCGGGAGSSEPTSTVPTVPDQSTAAPVTTTVFTSGQGGFNTYRIPAIVQARNGWLLAFAEGRTNPVLDSGKVELVLRRSIDDGRTWSKLQVVASDSTNFVGNPSPVVDQKTGRVVVLLMHKSGQDTEAQIDAGQGVDTSRVELVTSSDNGVTWGPVRDITASVKRPDWRWFAVGPGHGIQLTSGPHAGRLLACADHTDTSGNEGDNLLLSDDGGGTWKLAAVDTPGGGPVQPDECTSAQQPDGTIVFSSRNQSGSAQWNRLQTTSSTAGASFAAPFAQQAGLLTPVVEGSLLQAPGTTGPLLFSAPSDPSDRRNLAVRSSTDGGATWSGGTTITAGPAGYSDLVGVPGGRIGVLYETGVNFPVERIDFTTIGQQNIH